MRVTNHIRLMYTISADHPWSVVTVPLQSYAPVHVEAIVHVLTTVASSR